MKQELKVKNSSQPSFQSDHEGGLHPSQSESEVQSSQNKIVRCPTCRRFHIQRPILHILL